MLEGLKVEARARKKGKTGPLELYGGAPGEEGAEEGAGEMKKGGGPGVLPIGFGTGACVCAFVRACVGQSESASARVFGVVFYVDWWGTVGMDRQWSIVQPTD